VKLGLLTAAFPDLTLEQVAAWAASEGYETLEVACWPAAGAERRRYAGVSHVDVDDFDPDEVLGILDRHGLAISALAYYPNNLHPDDEVREAANAHLRTVIDAAARLGVEVVGTFVGNDKDRPFPENLERFNNLAWCPAHWDAMFEAIPTDHFGLNLDPSHLVWLMIDPERVVYDYADRIFHAHAKDLEIRRDGLYRHGTFSGGLGWQVPRLPGLGEVDWSRFVAALIAVGYDSVLSVEHEDRRFEGDEELVKRGFLLARNALKPLLV
jgi:sugar phosphate isomerase/epimerase